MGDASTYFYGHYNPAGDILVIFICLVFLILMHSSFITKSDSFVRFRAAVIMLLITGFFSLGFHLSLLKLDVIPHGVTYALLGLYHVSYYVIFLIYIHYMKLPLRVGPKMAKRVFIPACIVCGLGALYEFIFPFTDWGFQILEDNKIVEGLNLFPYIYIYCAFTVIFLLFYHRKRIYRQVIVGITASCVISFVILFIQILANHSSYTVASFLFPTFSVLYMIHSNPYNLESGAVDAFAFEKLLEYAHRNDKELILMGMYLPDLDHEGAEYPEHMKELIRQFAAEFFHGATLFQFTNGRMILVADVAKNPDHEQVINRMLNRLDKEFPLFRVPFKVVIMKTMDRIGMERDYLGLALYAESLMPLNSVHFIENKDVDEFLKRKYILQELQDICRGGDLEDPRVEVFCQPVLNIETRKYDTAEALMRIDLKETGRIFPDVFIPLAEEHGLIHGLSLVILHKTCKRIQKMMEEGYMIQRISINISALELRDDNFCGDVSRVIRETGIPFEKVAIELTESQNESDFMIMKNKISQLKENGIKFYLDDFGTGYSNFERIMVLPFDIIKFDRSLVLATASDQKSEMMVSHLAKMFSDLDYAVLYEGVETPKDEENCVRMNAKYLQGYKYSRPIPMEQLTEYFEKAE